MHPTSHHKPDFHIPHRLISDLSIPRKLGLMGGIFCLVIFGNLAISYIGMEILSGGRAYVEGEGLWSKAQKGAAHHLMRYAFFHDEADYRTYQDRIAIPLGDHEARLALAKATMDFSRVEEGFLQGRNHRADIPVMAFMARHLSRFHYMGKALDVWTQADEEIQKLLPIAEALHREIGSGHPSESTLKTYLSAIQDIDSRLTPLEDEFSYVLGQGARWLKETLLAIQIASTLIFLAAALFIAFQISRHLCEEIDQLRRGAARIAGGDYSLSLNMASQDEIGDLSRTFQKMAVQRQKAEHLKDEFFANISHELRTPLTLILSPLESILSDDRGALEPTVRQTLETIHNNAVRLLQLVNGLLDFSKLDANQLKIYREPVRIADMTEMVYRDFLPAMKSHGFQSSIVCDPPNAVVRMDRYLYERILFNLLSNAVKFTPDGGSIGIAVQWAAGRLTLSVSDSGIGIAVQDHDSIFQRFRQVEGSSSRRFEGTGLGLSLVKEFASLLEGTVTLKSSVAQGSTFIVECSAPEAPGAGVVDAPTSQPPRARQILFVNKPTPVGQKSEPGRNVPTILIAEDNSEMASYIDSILAPWFETRIVRDGNEALKALGELQPDLILTDVMMPERDGLSLCRQLKANPVTAEIPVIMLTAMTHREALLDGWNAGADDYLYKPFHPKELLTRVNSFLKARHNQKEAAKKINHLNKILKRHMLDLSAANKELEAFSYSVSHDLRAPLRAIDGFSREILTHAGPSLDDRAQSDLQRILSATQRMAQLIDDLLELSHLTRHELDRKSVDLSGEAQGILSDLQGADPARSVQCIIHPKMMVEGDPRLLHIALENLIKNSWKFTQRQAQPKIEFGTMEREGEKLFYVKDNGVGFNMEYAGKLFKPFQRLHDTKDFPGTGIGLALVWRIIHRHGGRLWTEAQENKGATFYFTLASTSEEEVLHERPSHQYSID